MNISKTTAHEVAKKVTEKKKQVIDDLQIEFSEHLEAIYKKQIPAGVLSEFGKNKAYFKTTSSTSIVGEGFDFRRENFTKNLPYKDNNAITKPSPEEAAVLIKISNGIDNLKKEYEQTRKEVEAALISLRTYKRIEENFPEAFLFLPKQQNTALVVNLESLRRKLK